VLRLLCTGATKNGVAAALFISPSTADHHVRHIYAKLGVRSRAAATLYAAEHGLL
jgi:DNA-binding NarL/FixJ family response regulator